MSKEYKDYVAASLGKSEPVVLFELPGWKYLTKGDFVIAGGLEYKTLTDSVAAREDSDVFLVLRQLYGNPLRAQGYMKRHDCDWTEYDKQSEGEEA